MFMMKYFPFDSNIDFDDLHVICEVSAFVTVLCPLFELFLFLMHTMINDLKGEKKKNTKLKSSPVY